MMALHFLRPYWFLTIMPLVILCWRLNKIHLTDNWRLLCDEHLLSHLLVLPPSKFKPAILLLFLASLIAILALAGPSWEREVQPIFRAELGNMLVLNLSPSMSDTLGTTKKIDRARFKMLDYLQHLKEGQVGLVIYTDEAHVISPLTEDYRTIANFVPSLDPSIMPTYKDDTAIGLAESEKLLKQAGLHQGNIILITDKITHFSAAEKLVKSLRQQGFHLYVFAITQTPNSEDKMIALAKAGGGKFIPLAANNQDIDELIASTKIPSMAHVIKKTENKGLIWQDNGRVLVFLLLPFALLAFRRGYL